MLHYNILLLSRCHDDETTHRWIIYTLPRVIFSLSLSLTQSVDIIKSQQYEYTLRSRRFITMRCSAAAELRSRWHWPFSPRNGAASLYSLYIYIYADLRWQDFKSSLHHWCAAVNLYRRIEDALIFHFLFKIQLRQQSLRFSLRTAPIRRHRWATRRRKYCVCSAAFIYTRAHCGWQQLY